MRSAQELDAELRRMRRSMRTVIGAVTFAAFVGIALIVGVVGGTLAVVDKNAAQALKGEPRKAEQPPRKTEQAKIEQVKAEQAKAEQAKAEQAKATAAPPPARATASPTQPTNTATPAPAQTNGTNTAASTPAPPTAASMPAQTNGTASTQTNGAASAETNPAQAEAAPRKQAEESKKARKRIVRARPERDTPPQAPDVAAGDAAGPDAPVADTPQPAGRREDARSRRRGYARLRDEDRARALQDATGSDRVTVITTERPRYARPELPERPAYDGGPRDRGLFGGLFGGRED
jgi:hypothetical protein